MDEVEDVKSVAEFVTAVLVAVGVMGSVVVDEELNM